MDRTLGMATAIGAALLAWAALSQAAPAPRPVAMASQTLVASAPSARIASHPG